MERFMLLRNYVKTDCAQLAWLFYDTVHTVNAKAAPHNYVCGSQRIFCTSSAVSKTGNTYSIPSFLKLCTGTKSLAELPCQIMRCCLTYFQDAAWIQPAFCALWPGQVFRLGRALSGLAFSGKS